MKKKIILSLLFIAFVGQSAFAQQKKDWKEMKAFHGVMSKTFHPSEDGNFKPLKDSAAVLLVKATAWKASTAPEGYNTKLIAPILDKLVQKCTAINAAVKAKKADADLRKLIIDAHNIFHEIVEKCSKEEHQD